MKFAEPMVTVGLTFVLLGERTSAPLVACVAVASVGAYIASTSGGSHQTMKDILSPHAATCAVVMLASYPLRNVCAKHSASISGPELYGAMSGRGAQYLVPLALGRFLFATDYASPPRLFAVMACLHAIYNLVSFRVLADVYKPSASSVPVCIVSPLPCAGPPLLMHNSAFASAYSLSWSLSLRCVT